MHRRKKPATAAASPGEDSSLDSTSVPLAHYKYFTKPGSTPTGRSNLLPDTPEKERDTEDKSEDPPGEPVSPTKNSIPGTATHSSPLSTKPDLKTPSPFTPKVKNLKRWPSRPEDRKKPQMVGNIWRVEEIVAEWTDKDGKLHYLVDWVKSWAPATDSFITPGLVKEWERKKEAGQVSPAYSSRYYAFPGEEVKSHESPSSSKAKKRRGKKTKSKRKGKGKGKEKACPDSTKHHIPEGENGDEMDVSDDNSDDDGNLDSDNPSKENSQDVVTDSEEANIYSASPTPPTRAAKKCKLAIRTRTAEGDKPQSTSSDTSMDSSPSNNTTGGDSGNTGTVPRLISAGDFYGAGGSAEGSPSAGKGKKQRKKKKDAKGKN